MNIRDRREIRLSASHALANNAGNPQAVAWVYGGIVCGMALLGTILSYVLNVRIADTGGLSNMGLRTVLSTAAEILPIVQTVVGFCLELGYLVLMLRVARGGNSVYPRDLTGGIRRFGALVRALILQYLIYIALAVAATYLSSQIFLLLPAADAFMEVVAPLTESLTVMSPDLVLDDATLAAAMETMIPMFWILGVLLLVFLIPVSYRFRMVAYCIADADHPGARLALHESRKMMKGNCFALFRLDLDFWWYYLLQVVVTLVCYGDTLLPLLGIALPFNETVSFFGFLILSLALQLLLYVRFMNHVTVTYATAYDALRPKPQNTAVLGNIFDM